jgi:hypothetical protein
MELWQGFLNKVVTNKKSQPKIIPRWQLLAGSWCKPFVKLNVGGSKSRDVLPAGLWCNTGKMATGSGYGGQVKH